MIEVPVIITFRGPSLSITVPPMVAPANVMHDETDPIHAVTELQGGRVSEWFRLFRRRESLHWVLRQNVVVVVCVECPISGNHLSDACQRTHHDFRSGHVHQSHRR